MLDLESDEALAGSVDRILDTQVVGAVLAAAVELGLPAAIAQPTAASDVARSRGLPLDGVERVLCALTALGLAIRGGDGRFVATRESLAVLGSDASPSSRTRSIRFRSNFVSPVLGRLAIAVRSSAPQHGAWPFVGREVSDCSYEELQKHPEALRVFLDAMDEDARGNGTRLAGMLELGPADRVIDGGCGGGALARELLTAIPDLRVESFDLESAALAAKERSERAGLAARHRIATGDLRHTWPFRDATVVVLAGVLSDFAAAARREVLRRAAEAARADARLVLCERLLTNQGTSPPAAALLSLVLLAGTEGGQLHRDEVRGLLAEGGWQLESIRSMSPSDASSRSVVVARRAPTATG